MAFPWLQYETFDDGTRGGFDAETDASSILDFPHYYELARQGFAPFTGAHAVRVVLSGNATANIQENTGFDTALAGTIHVWFPVCIGADLSLTAGNAVVILALQSAGAVNEVVVGVRNNSGTYELFCGETGATRTLAIVPNNKRWYQIEIKAVIDSGVGNDGTIDFFVDGGQVGAQITGLDQAAIDQAQLGAVSGTAAGNTGTILIGAIIADDARVFLRERFPLASRWITRDITAFIGPGVIEAVNLTGTSTDAVITIFDTDVFESTRLGYSREPIFMARVVVANDNSPQSTLPIRFKKGCYVQLTGTSPQAWLMIADDKSSIVKSAAGYVQRGQAAVA